MEDILIAADKDGGTTYLTTNSPASHYGAPVLRIEADDVDGDFGPADIIGDIIGGGIMTAADIVYGWGIRPERTDTEFKIARSYLSQWPDGPQLPPGPGRPPVTNKRKARVVKMTDQEWAAVQQAADSADISASEYVRRKSLEGAIDMKKIEVIAYEMRDQEPTDVMRMQFARRFSNADNAERWINKCLKEIEAVCGNGWPTTILIDGFRILFPSEVHGKI